MKRPKVTTTLHLDWLEHRVLTQALYDAKTTYLQELGKYERANDTVAAKRQKGYIQVLDSLLEPFEAANQIVINRNSE